MQDDRLYHVLKQIDDHGNQQMLQKQIFKMFEKMAK